MHVRALVEGPSVAVGRGSGGDDAKAEDGAEGKGTDADADADAGDCNLFRWFRCIGPEFVMGRALLEPNPNLAGPDPGRDPVPDADPSVGLGAGTLHLRASSSASKASAPHLASEAPTPRASFAAPPEAA